MDIYIFEGPGLKQTQKCDRIKPSLLDVKNPNVNKQKTAQIHFTRMSPQ
jgi:hypothetical protein